MHCMNNGTSQCKTDDCRGKRKQKGEGTAAVGASAQGGAGAARANETDIEKIERDVCVS